MADTQRELLPGASLLTSLAPGAAAAGLTVGALFQQQVLRNACGIAIEGCGRVLTYAELGERIGRLACVLAGQGIRRGDRIALLSENRPEYLELQLAAARLGAILACQNWRQSEPELQHCIRLVAPSLLITSEKHSSRVAAIDHGVRSVLTLGEEYEAILRRSPATEVPDAAQPEDGLVILYTSGTTGLPKAAVISHRAMIARSVIARTDGSFFPDRTFIAWTPLFHMGATDSTLAALMHGAKVVVLEGFDPPAIAEMLQKESIGWLSLMPGMFARMIEELRRTPGRLKPVGLCGAMADLVPRHEISEITTILQAPFRNSFGSTETGPAPFSRGRIPIGTAPQRLSKLQSSYCLVRLMDPEGRDVPDGEPGEAAFRGPSLFSGYWGDAAANAEAFRDGWYHMGDVLRRNADGSYDFVDRRKYLIKSGGENIYPAEIEQVLLASPRIAEAVVVRRADPRWGEVPIAFVAPREPGLTEAEVLELCRGRIAGYKMPKAVRFLPEAEFPRSTSGKVQRHLLEARLQRGAELAAKGDA